MRLSTGIALFSAGLAALLAPAELRADCTVTGSGSNALTVCVTVSTSSTTLTANQAATLKAVVTVTGPGTSNVNLAVTWTASPSVSGAVLPVSGSLSGSTTTNIYTAPASITAQQSVTVTATAGYDGKTTGTATITLSPGASLDIGSGAPNSGLQEQFFSAFYRNGFSNKVSLPPLGQVKALGTSGYVQEFQDAAKTAGVKYALATASSTAGPAGDGSVTPVVQIWGDIYAYYLSIGATTAGYPLQDTQTCPASANGNSCTYQFFDKSYALFVYNTALPAGADFSVSGAIYTEWVAQGALSGVGIPNSAPASITASTATTASAQTFTSGGIYSIASGPNKGKTFSVLEPVYDFYTAQNGPAGPLGLPASEVLVYQSGLHVQPFEHGAVQYLQGGAPSLIVPVASLALSPASSSVTTLNLGQHITLTASPMDASGNVLPTPVSWSSSNGQVISIQPNAQAQTALITAVGAGSASVSASSGGIASARVSFTVVSPCCQVGDGAPAAVQQAFQTALARNNITVQLPLPQPAAQVASGYIQMIPAGGANPALLLAEGGGGGAAYVVTGALLTAYQALGGPAGTLGYPLSDASAGGSQRFAGGALGGNPVRLVTAPILTKWAALGYDAGTAGVPASDAAAFTTFGGNSGVWQAFLGGSIYGATVGPRAGQTYFVSGPILAAYNAAGGPAGDFGMPTGDEVDSPSLRQQSFEGGAISYVPGASAAQTQLTPKTPAVAVAPASIAAGGQVRLAVSGFTANTPITVSITGQPNFIVTTANGAYSWDMFVPLTAQSATLTIRATGSGGAAAAGTLTVRGFANNRVQLSKIQGDLQTGAPGALLPVALTVALADTAGNPVIGAPVVFQGMPGVQLSAANAVTDGSGRASTQVRLPMAAGAALVTANSPSIASAPVTFSLLAQASGLTNFPKLQQAGTAQLGNGPATIAQKGALLTAVASILQYRQNRGDVPSPNGAVSVDSLNRFLTGFCTVDPSGHSLCDGFWAGTATGEQVVNLWRAAQFTGGFDVGAISPSPDGIADLVSQGEPVLLSLALSLNGTSAGGNFVVATGIAADGSIQIYDPNPFFARTNLNDYLAGFSTTGGTWTATLAGAVRFAVRLPGATRFLLGEVSQPAPLVSSLAFAVTSSAGACGVPVQLLDSIDAAGNAPSGGPLVSEFTVCDGTQPSYELDVGAAQSFHAFVTDLAPAGGSTDLSGTAPAAYAAARPGSLLVVTPQAAAIAANGVVNAASFTPGIAPGGIVAIFGQGLAATGAATAVDVDGTSATVLSASPFQVNAVIPAEIAPGNHTLHVHSPFGTAQQTIAVAAAAPAIFLLGSASSAAIVNQDGTLNASTNPAARGQYVTIYATGLGAVAPESGLPVTAAAVSVVINGTELPAAYAGLTPGYFGLYQVNIELPASLGPGLGISLTLKEGGQLSNVAYISLQ